MLQVRFFNGVKANLDVKANASELVVGGLYFTTDTNELFRATAENTYAAISEQLIVVNALDTASAKQGKLYLNTTDMTLNAFNGSEFKQLSAPADALVNSDISELMNTDDTKLASKKSIKEAINGINTKIGNGNTASEGSPSNATGIYAEIEKLDGKIATNAKDIDALEAVVGTEEAGLVKDVADLKGAVNVINGNKDVTGSIDNKIAAALKGSDISELKAQVEKNTTAIGTPKVEATDDAEAKEATGLYAEIEKSKATTKTYVDKKVTDLVNSAPEAMDTLGELAKAITDHQDVYEAYVDTVSKKIGKKAGENGEGDPDVSSGLYLEIEEAVKAEKNRAEAAEKNLDNKVTALETIVGKEADEDASTEATGLVKDVADLKEAIGNGTNGLTKEVETIKTSLTKEIKDRENADKALGDRLNALEADEFCEITDYAAGANYEKNDVVVHNGIIYRANEAITASDKAPSEVDAPFTALTSSAEDVKGIRNELNKLVTVVGKEAESENPATGLIAKVENNTTNITNNTAEINTLKADKNTVGSVDYKIEQAKLQWENF